MSGAFRCDSCGEFHSGKPSLFVTVEVPEVIRRGTAPKETRREWGESELCEECSVESRADFVEHYQLAPEGDDGDGGDVDE